MSTMSSFSSFLPQHPSPPPPLTPSSSHSRSHSLFPSHLSSLHPLHLPLALSPPFSHPLSTPVPLPLPLPHHYLPYPPLDPSALFHPFPASLPSPFPLTSPSSSPSPLSSSAFRPSQVMGLRRRRERLATSYIRAQRQQRMSSEGQDDDTMSILSTQTATSLIRQRKERQEREREKDGHVSTAEGGRELRRYGDVRGVMGVQMEEDGEEEEEEEEKEQGGYRAGKDEGLPLDSAVTSVSFSGSSLPSHSTPLAPVDWSTLKEEITLEQWSFRLHSRSFSFYQGREDDLEHAKVSLVCRGVKDGETWTTGLVLGVTREDDRMHLLTRSRFYRLRGPMNVDEMQKENWSASFIQQCTDGLPCDWKRLCIADMRGDHDKHVSALSATVAGTEDKQYTPLLVSATLSTVQPSRTLSRSGSVRESERHDRPSLVSKTPTSLPRWSDQREQWSHEEQMLLVGAMAREVLPRSERDWKEVALAVGHERTIVECKIQWSLLEKLQKKLDAAMQLRGNNMLFKTEEKSHAVVTRSSGKLKQQKTHDEAEARDALEQPLLVDEVANQNRKSANECANHVTPLRKNCSDIVEEEVASRECASTNAAEASQAHTASEVLSVTSSRQLSLRSSRSTKERTNISLVTTSLSLSAQSNSAQIVSLAQPVKVFEPEVFSSNSVTQDQVETPLTHEVRGHGEKVKNVDENQSSQHSPAQPSASLAKHSPNKGNVDKTPRRSSRTPKRVPATACSTVSAKPSPPKLSRKQEARSPSPLATSVSTDDAGIVKKQNIVGPAPAKKQIARPTSAKKRTELPVDIYQLPTVEVNPFSSRKLDDPPSSRRSSPRVSIKPRNHWDMYDMIGVDTNAKQEMPVGSFSSYFKRVNPRPLSLPQTNAPHAWSASETARLYQAWSSAIPGPSFWSHVADILSTGRTAQQCQYEWERKWATPKKRRRKMTNFPSSPLLSPPSMLATADKEHKSDPVLSTRSFKKRKKAIRVTTRKKNARAAMNRRDETYAGDDLFDSTPFRAQKQTEEGLSRLDASSADKEEVILFSEGESASKKQKQRASSAALKGKQAKTKLKPKLTKKKKALSNDHKLEVFGSETDSEETFKIGRAQADAIVQRLKKKTKTKAAQTGGQVAMNPSRTMQAVRKEAVAAINKLHQAEHERDVRHGQGDVSSEEKEEYDSEEEK